MEDSGAFSGGVRPADWNSAASDGAAEGCGVGSIVVSKQDGFKEDAKKCMKESLSNVSLE